MEVKCIFVDEYLGLEVAVAVTTAGRGATLSDLRADAAQLHAAAVTTAGRSR